MPHVAVPRHVRILVFGAGAIGSLFGGLLSRENDVTVVARKAHVDAINRRGLRIRGLTNLLVHPTGTADVPTGDFDAIFVTTKAYDAANALDALRKFWRRSTFVTLQNGPGNADVLAGKVDRVVAGTTTHGVTFDAPGEIVHAGIGDTVVGPWKGVARADVQHLADALTAAGIETTVADDVRRELWAKAVVNAAINPLTAVLRVPNGALAANADLRALVDRLAREGATAAAAAGVAVDPEDIAAKAVEVASRTAKNRSSMLQDVERGHRTEVDAITGELIRVAASEGRRLPYNESLYTLMKGLEWSGTVPKGTEPRPPRKPI